MAKTLHSLKDLKGLIPKDEPVRPAVKAKHSEKPAEPVKVNSDPKVGDMVVLMESDEHGKIQRIDKKTYYVRLDDGMVVSLGKFQMDAFKTEIKKCLPHRGMRVRFITGVGDYVLTNAIRKELDEVYALRCTYTVGTPGVTVVTVR